MRFLAAVLAVAGVVAIRAVAGPASHPNAATRSPQPVPSAASQSGTPPPAGYASIHGTVVGPNGESVPGARISLQPYGLSQTADTGGRFAFLGLRVPGPCVWATLRVQARGFGTLIVLENPIYSGQDHTFDAILEHQSQQDRVGPPLADPHMRCARSV